MYPPPDNSSPQLTLRAVLTGMVLGGTLSLCNIYSGLKVGWSFNVSIAAALLSYAFWQGLHRATGSRAWGLLENNTNQTAASSAASIVGAGLVAPIPALTLLTGRTLGWPSLALWTFTVSLVGVVVAVVLRRQMLVVDKLPFPAGIATAETLREVYGHGREAMARIAVLATGAVVAAVVKVLVVVFNVRPLALPGHVAASAGAARIRGASLGNLGFALDPSPLMMGFGAIVGLRAGLSLLLGAVVGWGIVAPRLIAHRWVDVTALGGDGPWFGPLVEWLLWPGVALMVSASLVSLAFSWRSFAALLRRSPAGTTIRDDTLPATHAVPRRWTSGALMIAACLSVILQVRLFGISVPLAVVAVMLTFLLAIVAGRVSGETGITPIGAMGKVTQLSLGLMSGGQVATNLMSANVTGGAASQCADMLHDLKAGLLIGASPRAQAVAQTFGVLAGSLAGSAAYLLLVPDPKTMLLTEEWPAPAVATWKAVAELLARGWEAVPPGSIGAVVAAAIVGGALAAAERLLGPERAKWLPSATSVGLGFVIPAWNSMSIASGAVLAALLGWRRPRWTGRFMMVIAGGLVAGESLAGIGTTLWAFLSR